MEPIFMGFILFWPINRVIVRSRARSVFTPWRKSAGHVRTFTFRGLNPRYLILDWFPLEIMNFMVVAASRVNSERELRAPARCCEQRNGDFVGFSEKFRLLFVFITSKCIKILIVLIWRRNSKAIP